MKLGFIMYKKIGLLCLLFMLGYLTGNAKDTKKPKRPNIILILTDDQGYGDCGRHGHPLLKTPNMDRLYDESVRFNNFYVSPSCSPTRASLLTGMHEFKNGVTHTINPRQRLNPKATIIPQLLNQLAIKLVYRQMAYWHRKRLFP